MFNLTQIRSLIHFFGWINRPVESLVDQMKLIISIVTLFSLISCTKAPSRIEIAISEDNSIALNGRMVDSLHSLRDEIRDMRNKYGSLPVLIKTYPEFNIIDFQNISRVPLEEGMGNIYIGSLNGDVFVLLPTFSLGRMNGNGIVFSIKKVSMYGYTQIQERMFDFSLTV